MSWLETLRESVKAHGQKKVAEKIGYSAAVVSQVLKGKYNGDLKRVQRSIEGALMGLFVECPVIGQLPRDRCIQYQRQPFASTNPTRVQLSRACPTCPNRTGEQHDQNS